MVTIKTEKEMNLPELIEWGWKNKIKNLAFYSNKDGGSVYFNKDGVVYVEHEIAKIETFTVEIEEEITEDTVIPEMLTIYDEGITHLTNNKSLNDLIKNNLKSAYIMNDDLRLILIWRDGRLIE